MQNTQAQPVMSALRTATKVWLAALCLGVPCVGAQTPSPTPMEEVHREIVAGTLRGASHGDVARYRPALLRIYADSTSRALWLSGAKLTPQAERVLTELGEAENRGLRASGYDAEPLSQTMTLGRSGAGELPDSVERLRADAWLTFSAMRFVDHVHRGRVDPRALGFALPQSHGQHDLVPIVVALSQAQDVHAMLDSLEPPFARFRALKVLLSRYRALAAASTRVRTELPGDGTRSLRRLLVSLGDIAVTSAGASPAAGDSLDAVLVEGVKQFQRRHGLAQDGKLGAATLKQLRVPLTQRIAQIELTMERWRWLPDLTSPRFVVVNIPAFRLYAFDRMADPERPVKRMDVIVGSAYGARNTPVFVGEMRDVVFHPYWDVPASIARNEEIPRIRRDPAYAEREGLEIVRGGDVGATVYPVTSANLGQVAAGTLRLRQRPGPRNALGPVKFVFPNRYNVYLHGTPAQSLFSRARRDLSHGCIRTSDPAGLAEFVLKGQEGWQRARIETAMGATSAMRRVTLDRPLPVYILYATVVIDDDSVPFFYHDVYAHDAALARALRQQP
ncbi:murein L,D-transpeptidase [soil metagenome]